MYTYTHTDTRLHMDWCTYIQYCMEVHRLCTLALATWNGKITLSPIRRRLFCLPRFVCVCCCFTYFPITIDIVYYLLVNFSPTLFACKRFKFCFIYFCCFVVAATAAIACLLRAAFYFSAALFHTQTKRMRRVRQRHIDKWQRRWQQNSESVARERERQRERRRHNRVERDCSQCCVCGCVSVCLLLLVMLFLAMSVCVLCERVFSVHVNELRVLCLCWCVGLPLLSWELYACMCVCVCDVDVKRSTQRTQWKNWRDGNSGGDNDDARKYLIKTKKSI